MNREIKFRGKDFVKGGWIYGHYMPPFFEGASSFIWVPENCNDHWEYLNSQVITDTVGQYTGLKDKNGVEIYPGDILFSKGKIIGYVVDGVRAYCYDVMYINHPNGEKRWTLWGTVTVDYEGDIEVKGNIYDNPELLKVNNHE